MRCKQSEGAILQLVVICIAVSIVLVQWLYLYLFQSNQAHICGVLTDLYEAHLRVL